MRAWLLALLLAGGVRAAVIRGTVVEDLTGQPLSRVTLTLEPLPGQPGKRMTARTNRYGFFELAGEPPGVYLLQAYREFFLTTLWGQKRWNSAGKPIFLKESETPFLTIRLLRFSSISGTVVDENDVGMPEFEVGAYTNTRPPQLVARATADDQGRYRIYGLTPGTYVVATLGKVLEGVGYKRTWAREADVIDQGRTVDVDVDQEIKQIIVHPLPGTLFTFTASATATEPGNAPLVMTFASEMGRQITKGAESVTRSFPGQEPGTFEVYADGPGDGGMQAEYLSTTAAKDGGAGVYLRRQYPITFMYEGISQQALTDGTLTVLVRRKDLAGTYDQRTIPPRGAVLPAGNWEFAFQADGYYTQATGYTFTRSKGTAVQGWTEIRIPRTGLTQRVVMSANVSTISGTVKDGADVAVGAPVYLEPMDVEPARRMRFAEVVYTDAQGRFKFKGLAPGRYRLLATFEYQMPDSRIMRDARATELTLDPRTDATRDLSLYIIP